MAKADQKPKKAKKKKKKGKKGKGKVQIFLVGFILLAAVFLPTAFLLFVGLIPFFVAFFTDRSEKKTKSITVGAMNLAGCVPFLMEMWTTDHSLDKAFAMVFSIIHIIVMYAAAAVGYLIDWAMTAIVSSILYQRGQARIKSIDKRQRALIERWGKDVAAGVDLDAKKEELIDIDVDDAEKA